MSPEVANAHAINFPWINYDISKITDIDMSNLNYPDKCFIYRCILIW